jgi:hypothetical protein
MKEEVDKIYADGRTTLMGDVELEEIAMRLSSGKYGYDGELL